MGRIGQAINAARETAEGFAPSPEAVKAAALNTCRGAYETCRGSGSVTTELKKAISSAIDVPVGMAANSLKACTQLLTLQPINATCTAARGLKDACVSATKAIVSPVPTALAAANQSLKVACTVVKLPITAPIVGYRVAKRGVTRATDMIFGSDAPAPANDNAGPASPPPAAAAPPPSAMAA